MQPLTRRYSAAVYKVLTANCSIEMEKKSLKFLFTSVDGCTEPKSWTCLELARDFFWGGGTVCKPVLLLSLNAAEWL